MAGSYSEFKNFFDAQSEEVHQEHEFFGYFPFSSATMTSKDFWIKLSEWNANDEQYKERLRLNGFDWHTAPSSLEEYYEAPATLANGDTMTVTYTTTVTVAPVVVDVKAGLKQETKASVVDFGMYTDAKGFVHYKDPVKEANLWAGRDSNFKLIIPHQTAPVYDKPNGYYDVITNDKYPPQPKLGHFMGADVVEIPAEKLTAHYTKNTYLLRVSDLVKLGPLQEMQKTLDERAKQIHKLEQDLKYKDNEVELYKLANHNLATKLKAAEEKANCGDYVQIMQKLSAVHDDVKKLGKGDWPSYSEGYDDGKLAGAKEVRENLKAALEGLLLSPEEYVAVERVIKALNSITENTQNKENTPIVALTKVSSSTIN